MLRALIQRFGNDVVDGRGREVRLYRPTLFDFFDGTAAHFPQADADRYAALAGRRSVSDVKASRQYAVGKATFAFVVIGGLAGFLLWQGDHPGLVITGAAIILILNVLIALDRWRCGALPEDSGIVPDQDLVRALLSMGRCASCTHGIADLPPDSDGCTVCPECGAAWKLEEEGTKGRSHEGTKV